jgi:hypothetical protein
MPHGVSGTPPRLGRVSKALWRANRTSRKSTYPGTSSWRPPPARPWTCLNRRHQQFNAALYANQMIIVAAHDIGRTLLSGLAVLVAAQSNANACWLLIMSARQSRHIHAPSGAVARRHPATHPSPCSSIIAARGLVLKSQKESVVARDAKRTLVVVPRLRFRCMLYDLALCTDLRSGTPERVHSAFLQCSCYRQLKL